LSASIAIKPFQAKDDGIIDAANKTNDMQRIFFKGLISNLKN
jgi:hypothetical protein